MGCVAIALLLVVLIAAVVLVIVLAVAFGVAITSTVAFLACSTSLLLGAAGVLWIFRRRYPRYGGVVTASALFPLLFAAVVLGHFTLLRLPYYWDEGGYYIPAALDFLRTGTLIPQSTITNAHPPLPSLLLAAVWKVFSFHVFTTRLFVCALAASALLAIYRISRELLDAKSAIAITLLTALYPIWFVQSTLAHADMFAAVFTLSALALYLKSSAANAQRLIAVAVLFSLSVLSKETAIVTPFALAVHRLWQAFTCKPHRREHVRWLTALGFCVLPLLAWYGFHYHRTGFVFGNPEFLRYNATANFDAHRIALSVYHRALHLLTHMNMYVATLLTAACFLLPRRDAISGVPRTARNAMLVTLFANWIAFSILGGALLTRYLLPMYPLLLLLMVAIWRERTRYWPLLTAAVAAAFLAALHINPPYAFAPEDNLTYRDMITLHQQAVSLIATRFPQATVLTAWPANAELSRPDLGYTATPIKVTTLQNFALDQIQKAAQSPGDYDTALLFSTKYEPPAGRTNLSRPMQNSDAKYFDFHRDVSPREAAFLLHGEVIWQAERNGEWAAVLRFPRTVNAMHSQDTNFFIR